MRFYVLSVFGVGCFFVGGGGGRLYFLRTVGFLECISFLEILMYSLNSHSPLVCNEHDDNINNNQAETDNIEEIYNIL